MGKTRILIVEDHDDMTRAIAQQLAILGYQPVGQTPRGEQAIVLAEQLRPDLVLMDIQLAGEMDGISAAQAIRERFAIPVVFLTAFLADALLERIKVSEPFGYIVKPPEAGELRTVIEMALYKHQAETRLRNSQIELAAILQTAMDGFCLMDAEGRFLEVNEAYCQLTGYRREELLRMAIRDVEADETPAEIAATIERIQRLGSSRFERRHRCKDGRLVHVEVSVNNLPGGDGRMVCFFRDVTERKRVEEALRISEAYYRALFQSANDAIIIIRDGTFSDCNAATTRLSGYSRQEFLGHFPADFAPARQPDGRDSREMAGEKIQAALEGDPQFFAWTTLRADGSPMFTEVSLNRIEGVSEPTVLAIVRDVSDRKQAEESLRDSEERFRTLIESAPEAIFVQSAGRFAYLNPAACRLFGPARPEDLLGKDFMERVAPECRDAIRARIALQCRTGQPSPPMDLEHLCLDGSRVPVETTAVSVRYQGEDAHLVFVRDISERKHAEEKLAESEAILGAVVESLPFDFFAVGPDGRYFLQNAVSRANWGLALGKTPEDVAPTREIRALWLENNRRAFAGEKVEGEASVTTKGETRIVHNILSPIRKGEQILGILGVNIDITDRKRTEEALRESEERFRFLVEAVPFGAWMCDAQGRNTYISPPFLEKLGMTAEQAREFGWTHALAPEDLGEPLDRWRRCMRTGEAWAGEWHFRMKDGTYRTALSQGNPLRDSQGEIVGWVGIDLDITDRKRVELELRENEERLRLAAEAAKFGTYNHDLLTNEAYWSPEFKALLGLAPDALCQTDEDLVLPGVHPEDRPALLEWLRASLDPQGPGLLNAEFRVIRPDGAVRWISAHGRVFFSGQGEARARCAAGTVLDVTDRHRAEETVRESIRRQAEAEKLAATGRMAALVAHEINNPLAGIKNSFRLIRDAVPKDHPDRDMVGRIEREIDRIARIVRQMYELHSPRAQTPREIPLGETIRDVLAMLEPLCREHEVTVELGPVPAKLRVWTPEGSLQQVLYNLTVNAVQASPRGGAVNITVNPVDENSVSLSIRDQGHGIPSELGERIFEPFVTAGAADSTKQGLGLGLSIVKSIVTSVGGRIEFSSAIDEGTCFHVYLPSKQP